MQLQSRGRGELGRAAGCAEPKLRWRCNAANCAPIMHIMLSQLSGPVITLLRALPELSAVASQSVGTCMRAASGHFARL